jgi:hypothetical protein
MSIVLPLKNAKSSQNLVDGPDFATWQHQNLVLFAQQANERLKAQEEQLEALRLDIRAAMEAYRKLLIEKQSR